MCEWLENKTHWIAGGRKTQHKRLPRACAYPGWEQSCFEISEELDSDREAGSGGADLGASDTLD